MPKYSTTNMPDKIMTPYISSEANTVYVKIIIMLTIITKKMAINPTTIAQKIIPFSCFLYC